MEKVTIGIPSYNSGRNIKDCLSSVLNQTYPDIEIIVIDNGSTDNTEDIVSSFRDPRVRFHKNPENIYCYGSYNVILNLAKADIVAIYHSDDVYQPTIVEQQVKFLQTHQNVMAVFTEANIINSKGEIIGEWKIPHPLKDTEILDFLQSLQQLFEVWRFSCMSKWNVCKKGFFRGRFF
ncbi:MAG: glycosyltransferase family 2 protein [Candidatus Omnitrophica bacterium]|nr:glycosyltransferase family 2 protein [Candidatus Omnitrophota bacterium]